MGQTNNIQAVLIVTRTRQNNGRDSIRDQENQGERPKSKDDFGLSTWCDTFFGTMQSYDFQASSVKVTLVQNTSIRAFKQLMNSSNFPKSNSICHVRDLSLIW